jgi:tetratricopeptide (TPR) repeat protein
LEIFDWSRRALRHQQLNLPSLSKLCEADFAVTFFSGLGFIPMMTLAGSRRCLINHLFCRKQAASDFYRNDANSNSRSSLCSLDPQWTATAVDLIGELMRLKTHALWLLCLVWLPISAAGQTPTDLRELGQREHRAGHYAQAESYFRTALDATHLDDADLAAILSDLGTVLLGEARLSEAEEAFAKSLAIEKRGGQKQPTAALLGRLGAVYSVERRDVEAIALLTRSLKAAQTSPSTPELTVEILNSLGLTYFRQGHLKKAEQLFQQALQTLAGTAIFELNAGPILNNLGVVYCEQRKYPLAEEFMTKSIMLTATQLGPEHPALTDMLDSLGVLYANIGRYADAEAQFQRAIAILGQSGRIESDVRMARSYKGLADTYIKSGRKAVAAVVLERAALVARRNLTHPEMVNVLEAYSRLLGELGKPREAKELRSEAQRARVTMAMTVRAYDQE